MPTTGKSSAIVRAFLAAMEARDLEAARSFLAPGFEMIFPGATPMKAIEELVVWSQSRYLSVGKTYDQFDELSSEAGQIVVYCFGHLHGVWPDGNVFDGIRFIDRFTVRDNKLIDQKVWNDMGEAQLVLQK